MRTRLFSSLILLAVFVAACAPASSTVAPAQTVAVEPSATPPPPVNTLDTAGPPASAEPTALPIATSRGSELHATDPSTVNLASGGLQLVEFFRFT